jgi:hypothetical protein
MAEEMGKNEVYIGNDVRGSHGGSHCEVEEDGVKTSLSSPRKRSASHEAQKAGV